MKRIICIHEFPGFYCSSLEADVDHAIEREREEVLEENGVWIGNYINFPAMHLEIAQEWLHRFAIKIDEACDLDIRLEFEKMTSPREYNFETDRLFAYISEEHALILDRLAFGEHSAVLAGVIKDMFTGYDGFIPFYSDDFTVWKSKGIDNMDHNELGVLLSAVISAECGEDEDWIDSVHEDIDFSWILDRHLDYDAWQKAIKGEVKA